MTSEVNKSGHVTALEFTDDEKRGVERHFNVKWDEMTDLGRMFKGTLYRHTLSPKAIADQILGTPGSPEIDLVEARVALAKRLSKD